MTANPSAPITSEKFSLLGTDVSAVTFDETVQRLLAAAADERQLTVHFCPVHTVVEAHRDPDLQKLLNDADIVAPDGVPLVWVGRARGRQMTRVCGPDLMLALIDQGREFGYSHYFYGGAPGTPERLAERLTARFPGLNLAGMDSPPFRALSAEEDENAVRAINAANPDFVWVGLGSPKQDRWVAEHRGRLNAAGLLAVGAAFDFHAGGVRRAPRWMQRTGLEWLFRFASEPRRLWKRYTVSNARFVTLLSRDASRALWRRVRPSGGDRESP